jgi:molecular chaperone DnaK
VSFDIDANGILHVSARDKATGKEQSIRITSSSGLSEDDINGMIREAEEHESDDRRRKDIVEAKNTGDSLAVHHWRKTRRARRQGRLHDQVQHRERHGRPQGCPEG